MPFIQTIISFLREKEHRNLLGTSTIVIIIGSFTYHYIEAWDYVDSFYF